MTADCTGSSCRLIYRILTPKLVGNVSLILVLLLWSFGNFTTEAIERKYNKPFLVTSFNNICFMIYFVLLVLPDPVLLYFKKRSEYLHTAADKQGEKLLIDVCLSASSSDVDLNSDAALMAASDDGSGTASSSEDIPLKPEAGDSQATRPLLPFSTWDTAKIALPFSLLYIASNCFTNAAFTSGGVPVVSILASTCGFFTFVIGWLAGVERVSLFRILSCLVAVIGVLVLVYSGEQSSVGAIFWSCVLALAGAVGYGLYSVYLKIVTRDGESRLSMTTLFAFCGLFSTFIVFPITGFILHFTKVETFEMPPDAQTWGLIAVNMIFGAFLPNYFWNVAFRYTSPLTVAVGLSLLNPLNIAINYFVKGGEDPSLEHVTLPMQIASSALIILALAFANVAEIYPQFDCFTFEPRRVLNQQRQQ